MESQILRAVMRIWAPILESPSFSVTFQIKYAMSYSWREMHLDYWRVKWAR